MTTPATPSVPPVMAGLVPAIHDLQEFDRLKTWMAVTSPAMTGTPDRPSTRGTPQ
jgi:hypothetical protein